MEHRHLPNSFNSYNMFRINQGQNHNHSSAEQSYIYTGGAVAPENGPFVCPMDNMSRGGVNSESHLEVGANEYSPSNFSMDAQHIPPALTGPPYDPYQNSSPVGSLCLAPERTANHMLSSYYNKQPIHDVEGGLLDPTTGTIRGSFKRKRPTISEACDRGSTSSFYGAGSSSGSSQMLEKTTSDYQSMPPGRICLPQYRGTGLSIAGEDSLRNVRSRSRLDIEHNTRRTHLSSYPSHGYHSTTLPANHSGMVELPNLNANATSREWNRPLSAAAHGRIPASNISGSSYERNRFLVGGSAADIGGSHHDPISSGHPVSSSQYLDGLPAQVTRDGSSNHYRRAIPSYRTGLSYSHVGHEAASSNIGLQSHSESLSSTYSRPPSAGGWHNSYRNGRSRMAIERLQSIASVVDAHDRMDSEDLMMVDHSLYGVSRSLFDHYRDMRLDIDNMSYEELLALGEMIGNVSTGLSDDMMSTCLTEKVYFTSDQNHKEETCAICLEDYKNEEGVGTLKNCGHDYHVGCIRKWLLMKNVCPICKAVALTVCSN